MAVAERQLIERLEIVETQLKHVEEKDSMRVVKFESEMDQVKGELQQIKDLLKRLNSCRCCVQDNKNLRNLEGDHEMSHINRANSIDGMLILWILHFHRRDTLLGNLLRY